MFESFLSSHDCIYLIKNKVKTKFVKYFLLFKVIAFYFLYVIYSCEDKYITFMHLADAFIQSDLQGIQIILFFVRICVPWELNPQPLRC